MATAPTFALTRPVLAWMASDPAWARLPWRWRAAARWNAHWGSVNWSLSEAAIKANEAEVPAPVFVLGLWRSGTTAMHELLAAATGLPTPRTWQCMNASAFALSGRPARTQTAPRPMDGISVHAMSPQEDEFALLTLGVPSAYRAFLMPHRLPQLHDTLDAAGWLADSAWLAPWTRFLALAARGAPPGMPLLLKSPNHLFRLPALMQRWPTARIVWMMRPAVDVFLSNRRMWQSMFALHGVTTVSGPALDDFLLQALGRSTAMLQWCLDSVAAGQRVAVWQPALAQAGVDVVSDACDRLGLPVDRDRLAAVALRLATTAGGRPQAPEPAGVPAGAQAVFDALDRAQAQLTAPRC